MSTLQQIQTAPEILVVVSEEGTELTLLDAKTMAVLSPLIKDKSPIVAPVTYCSQTEQLIAAQAVQTIINVWNIDQEAPSLKSNFAERVSCLSIDPSETILVGGGESGAIYIWQLPSGLLLKKFTAHNRKVISIAIDDQLCMCTASELEAKIWPMINVFSEQEKTVRPSQMINMKDRLLDILVTNERLIVLSEAAALTYKLHNAEREHIFQVENATSFACDPTSNRIYVGTGKGTILESRIVKTVEYNEVVLGPDGIGISKAAKERQMVGHKHPVSCLSWMNSLKYLVSGSKEGELIIWQNSQIKKRITLKGKLSQLLTIPRPSNHRTGGKKDQLPRIKALHKYEQKNNAQSETLEWICKEEERPIVEDPEKTFSVIMKELANEKGQLLTTLQTLQKQNTVLAKCSEYYAEQFLEKFDSA